MDIKVSISMRKFAVTHSFLKINLRSVNCSADKRSEGAIYDGRWRSWCSGGVLLVALDGAEAPCRREVVPERGQL
jgi:hypothetical protein